MAYHNIVHAESCDEQGNPNAYNDQGTYGVDEYGNWGSAECEEDVYTDVEAESPCDELDYFDCDPNNVARAQECPLPMNQAQCSVIPCSPAQPSFFDTSKAPRLKICGEDLSKINEIIRRIGPTTSLDEFMLQIAEYTPDRGEMMFDVMSEEVQNFKELINEIYGRRVDNVNGLLRTELQKLKNKYDRDTRKLKAEIQMKVDALRKIIPDLNLDDLVADPEGYLRSRYLANKEAQLEDTGMDMTEYEGVTKEVKVAHHTRTWLTREAERIECENEGKMCELNKMMMQLAKLSACLATRNKKIAAYNSRMENHATCLRNKLAYNEKLISCLTDEVDVMAATQQKVESLPCAVIEPDSVLTPYTVCECNYF